MLWVPTGSAGAALAAVAPGQSGAPWWCPVCPLGWPPVQADPLGAVGTPGLSRDGPAPRTERDPPYRTNARLHAGTPARSRC